MPPTASFESQGQNINSISAGGFSSPAAKTLKVGIFCVCWTVGPLHQSFGLCRAPADAGPLCRTTFAAQKLQKARVLAM